MGPGWFRPSIYMMLTLLPVGYVVLILAYSFVFHGALWLLLVLLALLLSHPAMIWFIKRVRLKDIWASERKLFPAGILDEVPMLIDELRKAGLEPARRERPPDPTWATIDVGKGLNVTLVPFERGVWVCVGPVRYDTRRETEHLERLIDAVLAPGLRSSEEGRG